MTKITEDHVPGLLHAAEMAEARSRSKSSGNISGYRLSIQLKHLAENAVSTTTSNKYKAELYQELRDKANEMGYENVTAALVELERALEALKMLHQFAEEAGPNLGKMFGIDFHNLNTGLIKASQVLQSKKV